MSDNITIENIIEQTLIRHFIKAGAKKGYLFTIEADEDFIIEDDDDAQRILMGLDEYYLAHAFFIVKDKKKKDIGWIKIVFGNGAYCISDYSVSLENFLDPTNKLADSFDDDGGIIKAIEMAAIYRAEESPAFRKALKKVVGV